MSCEAYTAIWKGVRPVSCTVAWVICASPMTIPCTNQPHPIPKLVLSPKNGCAIGFYPTSSTSLLGSPLPKVWCIFSPKPVPETENVSKEPSDPSSPRRQFALRHGAGSASQRCPRRRRSGRAGRAGRALWVLQRPRQRCHAQQGRRAVGGHRGHRGHLLQNWEMVVAVQDLDSDMIIDVQC